MTEQVIVADVNDAVSNRNHTVGCGKNNSRSNSRFAQRIFRSKPKDTLPVTIFHERIYILPSNRGLAFICVIAIMLMASINYGLNLGYALCFILIGLFASCLLATYKNLVKIKFTAITASNIFEGSALSYKVRVSEENKRHRSSISINNSHNRATFDLDANAFTEAELQITGAKRGLHTLGRLTLSSDFPLGLWRGWGYLHTPIHAYVYPKPENPVADFKGYKASSGGSLGTRTGEQEYSDLKTYENTDSPSRVAWKRVARGGGWYSKQLEAEAEQREVAIRWQDTPTHLGVEQRLSRMCGWVIRATEENVAYTFELPGIKPLGLASGSEHSEACLAALAAFKADNSNHSGQSQNT